MTTEAKPHGDGHPDTLGRDSEGKPVGGDGAIATSKWREVGGDYRTGIRKPDWWEPVADGKTIFVPDDAMPNVKPAMLREYARRDGKQLHTKRVTDGGDTGTVFWMTDKTPAKPTK